MPVDIDRFPRQRITEIRRDEALSHYHLPSKRFAAEVEGVMVLDVDGSLTVPGKSHEVDARAIMEVANFIYSGGSVIICTGATQGRLERTVLVPLISDLEYLDQSSDGAEFLKRVYMMPENGAVFLKSDGLKVIENEIHFDWEPICPRDLPAKREVVDFLRTYVVPSFPGSFILDDTCPEDKFRRRYIVSLKGLEEGSPRDVIRKINDIRERCKHTFPVSLRGIPWDRIDLKAARTTVDFVNIDANKNFAIAWALNNLASLRGPVVGIGDLGDEFARWILTFNVNQKRPNEFRLRGMPAVDLNRGYKLLKRNGWVVVGEGKNSRVLDVQTAKEIQVVRGEDGEIVFAGCADRTAAGREKIQPLSRKKGGCPMRIVPFEPESDGKPIEDAGGGAAWIIRRLIEVGYFDPVSKSCG